MDQDPQLDNSSEHLRSLSFLPAFGEDGSSYGEYSYYDGDVLST